MSSTDTYTVDQELVLAKDMHRLPVRSELKRLAGFDENVPPEQLLLAEVLISGGRYGGNWVVNAVVNDTIVGSIRCMSGTDRDSVLGIVDGWIRASEHTTFVPGRVHEVPVSEQEAPYFVYGLVLVRGDEL